MRKSTITVGLISVALAATLAGCGSDDPSDSAPPARATLTAGADAEHSAGTGTDTQQVPPIMVNVGAIDGTTQAIPIGDLFVLTGDTAPVTDWTADISPSGVVDFVPGRDDGSATYNPGLKPVAAGTATVTLANPTTDISVTFTVVID